MPRSERYRIKRNRALQITYIILFLSAFFLIVYFLMVGLIRDLEFQRLYEACMQENLDNPGECIIYQGRLGLDGMIFLLILTITLLLFFSWQYSKRTHDIVQSEIDVKRALEQKISGKDKRVNKRGGKKKRKSEKVKRYSQLMASKQGGKNNLTQEIPDNNAPNVPKPISEKTRFSRNALLSRVHTWSRSPKHLLIIEITYVTLLFVGLFLVIRHSIAPTYSQLPDHFILISLSFALISTAIIGILFLQWSRVVKKRKYIQQTQMQKEPPNLNPSEQ